MPWIGNLAGLAILAVCAWRGYRRGVILSLLGLLSMLCAYLGAFLLAAPIGRILHTRFGAMLLPITLASGFAVFVLIIVLFALATRSLRRGFRIREEERGGPGALGRAGRAGGALIGLGTGCLWILLLFWLYTMARGTVWGQRLPDLSGSLPSQYTARIVERGAFAALRGRMDEDAARRLAAMIGRPDQALTELTRILQHPSVRKLFTQAFAEDVLSGSEERIRANRELLAVFRQREVIRSMVSLGLLPDDADPIEQHALLSGQLALAGRRLGPALKDPQVQADIEALSQDNLWAAENIPRLLIDVRMLRLLNRVVQPESPAPEPEPLPE